MHFLDSVASACKLSITLCKPILLTDDNEMVKRVTQATGDIFDFCTPCEHATFSVDAEKKVHWTCHEEEEEINSIAIAWTFIPRDPAAINAA